MGTTERAETPVKAPEVPRRRVGTFTLGVALVIAGCVMLASLVWPGLDLSWALKGAPLILISLGIEALLAARGGGRVRYDWAGMVLCFVLVCAALCLYAASWWLLYGGTGGLYEGSLIPSEDGLVMEYDAFSGIQSHRLELAAGDTIDAEIVSRRGSVGVEIAEADGGVVYQGARLPSGSFSVEIPEDGTYLLSVTGANAAGSTRLLRDAGR